MEVAFILLVVWTCVLMLAVEVAPSKFFLSLSDTNGMQEFQEYFGCDGMTSKMTSDTIVEIMGGQNHSLFQRPMFCLLSDLNNITIRSTSSEQATLWCPGLSIRQTGFGFYNVTNLRLENIIIDSCGGVVATQLLEERLGESFFGPNQQAVITISRSMNVQLLNIEITNYLGYAIIGHTVAGEFRVDGLSVKQSYNFNVLATEPYLEDDSWLLVGSGLLLRYADTDMIKQNESVTIAMSDVEMINNRNLLPYSALTVLQSSDLTNRELVFGGNGVILTSFSNTEYSIDFRLQKANIIGNSGTLGGGITVVHIDSNLHSSIVFEDCHIKDNINYLSIGGGIQLYYVFAKSFVDILCRNTRPTSVVHTMLLLNSVIQNNVCPVGGGGLSADLQSQNIADIDFRIVNSTFTQNSAQYGDALTLERDHTSLFKSKEFNVHLDSVEIFNNGHFSTSRDTKSSCIYATGLTKLLISGSKEKEASFYGHSTSVIRATNSHVYLNGSVTFKENKGLRGGAISLSDISYLVFVNQSRITFAQNSADEFGGAIYIDSLNGLQCEIQFVSHTLLYEVNQIMLDIYNFSMLDYSIVFFNNSAWTGNAIYGSQIYNCTPFSDTILRLPRSDIDKAYQSLFTFQGSNFMNEVRSRLHRLCFCHSGSTKCLHQNSKEVVAYPGLDFNVSVIAVDVVGQPVHAGIRAYLMNWETNSTKRYPLNQIINNCSEISFSIITGIANIYTELVLHSDYDTSISISVLIHECPIGFTNINGRCSCTACYGLYKDICHQCLMQRTHEWFGLVNTSENQSVLAYSSNCPIGYCDPMVTNVNLRNSSLLHACAENREGFACGKCKNGSSNVFGSMACKAGCTSWWLFSIFVYMAIGILLVLVIYTLDLTVTKGTINGIVFYAQMTAITINIFSMNRKLDYATRLVRFINLEIGISVELCFYKEMGTLSKYTIQFLFPVYLGFIVLLNVALSKCKKIEKKIVFPNSVNIMVTLIYLSYGKILTTIVFLLTPLPLDIDDGAGNTTSHIVWYYDGTLGYFEGKHLIVGIVAVAIILFFIIPYQILILFSQWCLKIRFFAYYLPIVDANVAPFKHKYRFWFGMRLIITAFLITQSAALFTFFPLYVSIANVVVMICLLMIQAYLQPYKSSALNLLDLSFLLNLTLLYATSLLGYVPQVSKLYFGIEQLSSIIALLTFSGIIIYHTVKAVKKSKCFKKNVKDNSSACVLEEEVVMRSLQGDDHETSLISSVYDQYRESVLDL